MKPLIIALIASCAPLALLSCDSAKAPSSAAHMAKAAQGVKAKNVILFIGDGMGLSTITAARIFDGQSKGMTGEENRLSFEHFNNIALVKTYNFDAQVSDSAGTASAMNTGIKTQIGKINVTPDANDAGCRDSADTPPTTIADLAKAAGFATGIVSTARLTHATPAAVYGHSSTREFESDKDLDEQAKNMGCTDLASQLIASDIDIALGGGLRAFSSDERDDKTDLLAQWDAKSGNHRVVTSLDEFTAESGGSNILGLFQKSHMSFEVDRDKDKEPSLTDMTTFAISNLAARDTGYFLMVEGGRIDHAHHETNAYRALSETQELARAVQGALDNTDPEETLILVTADHSHVFTIAGYPQRGNPILGLVKHPGADDYAHDAHGNPYTTLGYQNGPTPSNPEEVLTDNVVQDTDFLQRVAIEMEAETHAGEDVILYAHGAWSETVRGVIDQTEIYGLITKAMGLDN